MAITSMDQVFAATAAASRVQFCKTSQSTAVAATSLALFRGAGNVQGSGTPTATGTALSRSTTGALRTPAPSGVSYLVGFEGSSSTTATYWLCDRLVETGGLSATVTTTQTVNSVAMPSRASAATDVELWLEWYTATGTLASTVTASYTNQDGTSGRTATLIGGFPSSSMSVMSSLRMALQAGDTGVRSVETFTLGTASASGTLGLTLRRTLAAGSTLSAATSWNLDWAGTGLTIIPDDACLELVALANGTSTGNITGSLLIAQG